MRVVAMIREMIGNGLSIEQALMAAELVENREISQLEARRANDRARKARHRENMSRDVTGGHVTAQVVENTRRHVTSRDPPKRGPPHPLRNYPPNTPLGADAPTLPKGSDDPRKLGQRLPDEWGPSEALCAFADGLGIAGHSLEEAVAEFRDYWRSIPGQRGRKLDWDATFRNRLRETAGRKKGPGNGKGNLVDAGRKLIRRLDEQFAHLDDVRPKDGGPAGDPAVRLLPGFGSQRS